MADLVIETALTEIRLGVFDREAVLFEKCIPKGRGELIDDLLDEALAYCGILDSDIKRVLVSRGPGSYTGLRTGIAFAQGYCFSGTRQLHAPSTLALIRTMVPEDQKVLVVLKARPGWFYMGIDLKGQYDPNLELEFLGETPQLLEYADCVDTILFFAQEFENEAGVQPNAKWIDIPLVFNLQSYLKALKNSIPEDIIKGVSANYLQKTLAEKDLK
jgi:tRNA threonylcarbamoyl adenosine modification protein YeaZ